MNTWQDLFVLCGISSGFIGNHGIELNQLGDQHKALLLEALKTSEIKYLISDNKLMMESDPLSITEWMSILEKTFNTRESWFKALDESQLIWIDPYMIGIVAQLNRLGYVTNYSCSGHGRREGSVAFRDHRISEICTLFNSIGAKFEVVHSVKGCPQINFPRSDETLLPFYALRLAKTQKKIAFCINPDLGQSDPAAKVLKELLELPGKSGEEHKVREYLLYNLAGMVDSLVVDQLGNIYGFKKYGFKGQTVLLSAHMDIYDDFNTECKIEIIDEIWRRPGEILGADDRAGVAMLLMLLNDLEYTGFDGTIKFAFTVQEECGRAGASAIPKRFLADIDFAIVLDRRGSGDLVTNCNGVRYCSKEFENRVEKVVSNLSLNSTFKPVTGGISDITVWSSYGIESVNVSIGFYNEHTEFEYLNYIEWSNTRSFIYRLIRNLDIDSELKCCAALS